MVNEGKEKLKEKIAQAAGINPKTIERGAKTLLEMLFGISEEDLEKDPALRAYLRYLLFGEDPSPYVKIEESEVDDAEN